MLIVIRRANFNVAKIAHKSELVTYRSLIIIRSCLMRNVSSVFFLSFKTLLAAYSEQDFLSLSGITSYVSNLSLLRTD